jgi:predicted lysophospholipase L1 biosynthesis ABC-type transport system permease subunit
VDRQVLVSTLGAAIPAGASQYRFTSRRALHDTAIAPVQWFSRLFELQGWALAGLASFGIIAFSGLWVRSLGGEIAIRRAVGARRPQIVSWVAWQALGVVVKGVFVGVWSGVALWSALPDVVSGTLSWDPVRLLPYAFLIGGLILSGVLPTAWYLSRGSPAELLQSCS